MKIIMNILISFIVAGIFPAAFVDATLYEGDQCLIQGKIGICTHQDNCLELKKAFYDGQIRNEEITRCGYSIRKEIICCPIENFSGRAALRPAIQYCNQIQKSLQPILTEHIIGGLPVNLGEYPHMAAIGYRSMGNDKEPYEFNCGGSLIASKFVLTAAHCVTDPRRQPDSVLLGAVSLSARANGVRVKVKQIYPHPQFLPGSTYNDIAIIELESDVVFSENIYPLCLHTNDNDLPANTQLHVSGWGQTEKLRHSDILLSAKVKLVSLENCNQQISATGPWRRLERGIQNTQICAEDTERDACYGDSGGPLILIKDKDLGHFNIVGITVSGLNCGGGVPSFYTRVSSYLDFIEEIVWPNLKK